MTLQEAKDLLNSCERYERCIPPFGDCEVNWGKDGKQVADGYFYDIASVCFYGEDTVFHDEDANLLRKCGKLHIERNDETGPDEYKEGVTMPGLTLEGVRKELERKDRDY